MTSGGKRLGSGRKPAVPGQKRIQFTITTTPETKERLKEMARERHTTIGKLFDFIIADYYYR